jgi:hypothetical protein
MVAGACHSDSWDGCVMLQIVSRAAMVVRCIRWLVTSYKTLTQLVRRFFFLLLVIALFLSYDSNGVFFSTECWQQCCHKTAKQVLKYALQIGYDAPRVHRVIDECPGAHSIAYTYGSVQLHKMEMQGTLMCQMLGKMCGFSWSSWQPAIKGLVQLRSYGRCSFQQ